MTDIALSLFLMNILNKARSGISTDGGFVVGARSVDVAAKFAVLKKSKTDFLRYIGYRNFINDLIKHVSLLGLVHVRLLFCSNC